MTEKPQEPSPTPSPSPSPSPSPYPPPTPTPSMTPDPHQHTWEEAQRMMLNQMTQDQKTAYFQMSPEQQNQMVQDFHQQNFGTNTTTDMPKGGPTVEGSMMPGGENFGKPRGV